MRKLILSAVLATACVVSVLAADVKITMNAISTQTKQQAILSPWASLPTKCIVSAQPQAPTC